MEVEKRKRFDEGELDEEKVKRSRREADGGQKAAAAVKMDEVDGGDDDDGEVEEFFAILRRIHKAVKYFEKGNGGSKMKSTTATPWRPNFVREDFEVVNGVKSRESFEEYVRLDLNADPDPDTE
ncbi:hypothetical protein ACH5RR_030201 [Cinchona calisaya]|uniref:Uncharacterized protein n=1 Tax=Cinchona calisaya TaxID=153742 RepID=A0ABD2YTW1_9GENT